MMDMLVLLLGLIVVLALAWAILRGIGQLRARDPALDSLRHLGAMAVGRQERLLVMRYHDQILLIGVTPGGMAVLDRRSADDGTNPN